MKNLVIHEQCIKEIQFLKDIFEADNETPEIQSTIDPYNNLYVIVKNELYVISYNGEDDVKKFSIGERECTKIVGLEYCVTMQELYCAYETGDVICIDISDLNHCKHNVVFQCKDGLQYIKLSSDCEIITMVTNLGTLIVTFLDFQIIKETYLYSSDVGTQQFVNVGWGKKETQFHGSGGKAAANTKKTQLNPNESDSGRIQITWQDNGQFFAISFLQPETKIRCFKIFDRESNLLYTNEKTNDMSDCLIWKGSEGLITTITKTENAHYFTYYEKNGLKYKCHPFPFKADEMTITDLLWSPNADILAVICKHMSSHTFLQLWTEHNNHMYLKQNLCFSDENPLLYASWTNKKMGNELILLSLKEVTICSFNWCINHSKGKTMKDQSVVVVIDGSRLFITAFRKAIIPPPFAHQIIDIEVPVNAIVFAPETSFISSNTFCAVLCDSSIIIFKQKQNTPRIEYEIFKRYNYCLSFTGSNFQCNKVLSVMGHFLWLAENIMLCSAIVSNVPGNVICILHLNKIDSGDDNFIELHQPVPAGKLIQHIVASPNVDEAYIISDSIVYKYNRFVANPTNISFDETCFQVDVVKSASDSKKHVIIALTHTHRLLLDGREYSNYVLSYFIHSDFLLFTTLRHCLICVPFAFNPLEEIKREDFDFLPSINLEDEPTKSRSDVRCIERGAHIITVIPEASKTILLMPRGNLECIEPRMLIVHIIKYLLDNCDYKKVFDFMKKQRMNFNLIYDHDPELFTQNAEKFLKDIGNPEVLSLFLSTLQNEDVTKTIYSNCYNKVDARKSENNKIGANKMAHICKLLRHVIEKQHNADELIQPLLITLLKSQNEEGLRTALIKIKELVLLENSQKPNCLLHISAEKALKFLLNAVDISILYDTALSMYDLELTMFIASKSQRDPKEYIPFLNSLKIMDEDYMKYTIDMHLKHYESALVHIAKDLSKFDKCLHLICSQKLYKQALKLFKKDTIEYKTIAAAFGEYLIQKKIYHEAGMMFYRSNDPEKALKAFMLAGSWEDSIIVLKKMEVRPTDLHVYYQSIVTYLKTDGKYKEAAIVLLHYLNNAEEAITVLCEGRNWKHAMRIAYDAQRPDLTEIYIKSGVTEHADFLLSQLNQTKEDFLQYKSRLILLRSRMNVTQELALSEMFSYIKLLPSVINTDTLSETTSIADSSTISTKNSETSIKSGKSYRSNKNRRKQQRKLLSLKEGSMFEDFGLINALYHIITSTYKNIDEWTQLLQMLMYFELDEIAEKLQDEINSFICLIQESKSVIWDKCAPSSLYELKEKSGYTPSQIYEITTPLRTLEPFIFFPPKTDVAYLDVI